MSASRVPTIEELAETVKKTGTRHEGQSVSDAKREELVALIAARADQDHRVEAATFCEEIIAWLNEQWTARQFTANQRIFSLALAGFNLRRTFPAEKGGMDFFDRVEDEAWLYFRENAPPAPAKQVSEVGSPQPWAGDALRAAAGFCEEIIAWLNGRWYELAFTLEQQIFSFVLAVINVRQHVPGEQGGSRLFDGVARQAWHYFAKHV
jgi:hypothetical protein